MHYSPVSVDFETAAEEGAGSKPRPALRVVAVVVSHYDTPLQRVWECAEVCC